MSLDQNLFTLSLVQSEDNPNVIDLVDSASGNPHYRRERIPGSVYKINVLEPLSGSVLATASALAATTKHKTIELYNPDIVVELKYTGTLSFKWRFSWEEHGFEWRREQCFIIRKPDPPVLVAITKEPAGRIKTSTVQLLDYNINRFDIEDRKGLEIVILTALLTFQDSNESLHSPQEMYTLQDNPPPYSNIESPAVASPALEQLSNARITQYLSASPPPCPPRPAPKTGVDRIAQLQAMRGEINEVTVEDEGVVVDYAQYCFNLLEDEAMLFITVRSSVPEQVPKVLSVVEEAKRLRHKAGVSEEEELHQYVVYDTKPPPRKGPRVINLDDPAANNSKGKAKDQYAPPTSLIVHLSKIAMPELQPRAAASGHKLKEASVLEGATRLQQSLTTEPQERGKDTSKERQKRLKKEKEWEKEQEKEKEREKEKAKGKGKERRVSDKVKKAEEKEHKLTKGGSSSPHSNSQHLHVHSNEVHPYQPSPSPSQLNNPFIYTAPPPPRSPRR